MGELTDAFVRNAKPKTKPYKVGAGRGMYLEVTPHGGKRWRFRYRLDGKGKLLSLGTYPDTTLARARERREELRRMLANGIDPSAQRRTEKAARTESAANSFESLAREWIAKQKKAWASNYGDKVLSRLERDIFPKIGTRPIAEVTAPELLRVLQRVEARDALETAHRELRHCGQVFRYAIATGRAERDPATDLRGALTPVKGKHMAALTEPGKVGALLRTIWAYEGSAVVQAALRLHPYVFLRPGELRMAEWVEINLEAAEWRIPVERMKMKQPHIVPLSRQAMGVLRGVRPLTGRGRFVFPNGRSSARSLSNAAEGAAMRRLGIGKDEFTPHGWRATARTLLDEQLGFKPEFIEHQLAHLVRDPLGRAYNRTKHLPERRAMMQAWSDYLDKLRTEN